MLCYEFARAGVFTRSRPSLPGFTPHISILACTPCSFFARPHRPPRAISIGHMHFTARLHASYAARLICAAHLLRAGKHEMSGISLKGGETYNARHICHRAEIKYSGGKAQLRVTSL